MKKSLSCFCLFLICILAIYSCRSEKPTAPKLTETEKQLLGTWKFLYTDAAEEIPPKDLTYSFLENHTCVLEYTGEENKKEKIDVTFEAEGDKILTFRDGLPSKEFHLQFESENVIRLTEKDSKNSIVLERIQK